MNEHDEPGSLIGFVLASLVERVTALEEHRELNKASVHKEIVRLYLEETPSMTAIAKRTGFNVKTVLNVLRKAGLINPPAQKKETV
jgi:hypothetical protein